MGQYSLKDVKAFAPSAPPPPDPGFTMPGTGPSLGTALRDTSLLGGAMQAPSLEDILAESGNPVLSPKAVEAARPYEGYKPAAPRGLLQEAEAETGQLSQMRLPPEMRLPPHVWDQLSDEQKQALLADVDKEYVNPAEATAKWGGRQAMRLGRFGFEHIPGMESLVTAMTAPTGRDVRADLGLARKDQQLSDLVTGSTYASRQAEMPEFGALDAYLQPRGDRERLQSGILDTASILALPSRAATTGALRQVPGVGRVIDAASAAVPRLANRAGAALFEGAVGAGVGLAQRDDPVGGAVFGALGGAALPGTTAGFEASQLAAAEKNIGRVLSPTRDPNKRWVQRNWQEFARTSPWFSGVRNLGERAEALADTAGRAIDRVLTGVRQGNVGTDLRQARSSVQRAANLLLAQSADVGVVLAPEVRSRLQTVASALNRLNPESTSLAVVQEARQTVTDAMRSLRTELADRAQQLTGMGEVEDVFQMAMGQIRNVRRAGARATRTLDSVGRALEPTRIRTAPILARLDAFRRTFVKVSDETGAPIIHNQVAVDAIDGLRDQITQHGRDMSVNDVRDVRQVWDKIVAGARGNGWLRDMAEGSRQDAQRTAANALRANIADKVPSIVRPNREFSYNTGLQDVIEDTLTRKTGQTHGLVESLVAGGGAVSALVTSVFKGGAEGLATASGAALLYGATRLLKSPEFNLVAAKTRLALLDALRGRNVDAIRDILMREMSQESAKLSTGYKAPAPGTELDEDEAAEFSRQLREGKTLPPGLTDPDVAPEDAFDAEEGRAQDASDPEQGRSDAEDAAELLGLTGDDQGGGEEAGSPEARAGGPPEVQQAGVGGTAQSVLSLLEPFTRPRVSLPRYGDEHPNVNRLMEAIEYNTSISDALNLGTSIGRPLSQGTRLLGPITKADRALGGLQTAQGLANVSQGLERGDPGQALGGAVGATFGGLSMRPNRVGAGGEVEVPGMGRRLLQAGVAGGVAAAAGPATILTAQALASNPELIKAIPDESLRNTIAQGLISLGLAKGGVSIAALAYLHANPSRKAIIHLVGDLSEGRSAPIARQKLLPLIEGALKAKNTKAVREILANNEPEAARLAIRQLALDALDKLEAQARPLEQKVDADSGRLASDVERAEGPMLREQGIHTGWYEKTKALAQEQVPAKKGDPVDPDTGLTAAQHFALEAMGAFGTNTPPVDNYKLYSIVADAVKQAPAGLDRPQLLQWLKRQITSDTEWQEVKDKKGNITGRELKEVERVFGMDPKKPGVPALRAIIEGRKPSLGGRKIESYFHNLGQIQRENPIGTKIDPATIDRWMFRYFGLPTEEVLKTGDPVYVRDKGRGPVELPEGYRQDQVDKATKAVEGRQAQLEKARNFLTAVTDANTQAGRRASPDAVRRARVQVEQRQSQLVAAKSALEQAQSLLTPEGRERGAGPSPLLLRGEHGGSVRYEPEMGVATSEAEVASVRDKLVAKAQEHAKARQAQMQAAANAESKRTGRPIPAEQQLRIWRAGEVTGRQLRAVERDALHQAQSFDPATKQQSENRKTAAGSEYVSQNLIADAGYEVTERTVSEVAKRHGLKPQEVQPVLWFVEKFGADLFGGARPTQGLPLDQQRTLIGSQEARLDPYLKQASTTLGKTDKRGRPVKTDQPLLGPVTAEQHRDRAETLLNRRQLALGHRIRRSIERNGGATFPESTPTTPGRSRFGSDVTAVSIFPSRTEMMPPSVGRRAGKLGLAPAIVGYMNNNTDLLKDPDYSIGGWRYNGRTAEDLKNGLLPLKFDGREIPAGTVIMDVVATASQDHNNLIAKSLGLDYRQYSVYDLLKGEEYMTYGLETGQGSPASRKARQAATPSPYAMKAELTVPASIARVRARLADPGLTANQRVALREWLLDAEEAERASQPPPVLPQEVVGAMAPPGS